MDIKVDNLTHPDVRALVVTHHNEMVANDNINLSNALDLEGLQSEDVTFFSVWEGETLTGCGAVRELDATHGEIKSMHTDRRFRRRGVSAALLYHITKYAEQRGYERLSLETHPGQYFTPAIKLYERFGFEECGPFGNYEDSEYSVFMTKEI
ncbi:GNAT family N-acetyltransferase [Hellea balneolensis]|uniref:GNAT family N-acetyltransferase n=1 Tax=Hellea balneolensis TaxID=287478 RepID=UPI00040704B8|nr:GNAT family N-acetyltransferase [Hellea balneolensis]